ncbi:MAG: LPS export ABC transporter permease LptF [Acidobacteriia bacterium]|nr:LPS export ABC transporter permease LptF [Methyloceanibacter sp.]MBX5471803.1 LPS export ABC transporter permease LptF [Acetobacteraceae bacterium]MCL6490970.1 LPS export ABC transporter permease LptF [Terriglobia bacterium]
MFPLLDRYIFRQLVVALAAATGGLVALIWITQSLRFLELVINHGLSTFVFLRLTSLLIPSFVAVILPITTYVVVQFVYQRLDTDRELVVMRAAGLSNFGLARSALVLALLVTALTSLLYLWIVPAASAKFREEQFKIRNRIAAFLLQEGVFNTVSDDLTIYVRARDKDGTLRGILIDDARQKDSHATILARSGRLIPSGDTPHALLFDGSREEIDHRTGRLNVLTFAQNLIELGSSGKGAAQRYRDATEMSLSELLHPNPAVVLPQDFPKLRAEAHKRMATPLTVLSFALVGLVAALTGTFRRYGGVLRPAAAVLVITALLALELLVDNLAARMPAFLPLIWVHAILPIPIALWLLFGPKRTKRLGRNALQAS